MSFTRKVRRNITVRRFKPQLPPPTMVPHTGPVTDEVVLSGLNRKARRALRKLHAKY